MAVTVYQPQKHRPVSGVLFDMDGVILDTEKLYTRFWQEAAQALGYPMTREQALQMRSLNREAGEAKLQSFFEKEISYQAVRQERIRRMEAYIESHGVEAKPGIRQLLDALDAKGIPSAIATSSPMERTERYLGQLGLYRRFTKICSGYQVPRGKPAPDIYQFAAASLSLPPENCLALEDSPAGILSAYRAGCMSVLVPDQDPLNADMLPHLYARADTLTDVIELL